MALSKLNTGKKRILKYLLADELDEEGEIFEKYGKIRVKNNGMFQIRCHEGMLNVLIYIYIYISQIVIK